MKRILDVDELAEHWSLKFEETQSLKFFNRKNALPAQILASNL